jgi:hypothetical protein
MVAVHEGGHHLMVAGETVDDVLARDRGVTANQGAKE